MARRDMAALPPPKKKIMLPNKTTTTTTMNSTTELEEGTDDGSSMNGHIGMALMGLYLFYIFFVYYMIATCDKWWHAALAIGIATAFLLLSFCLAAMQMNKPSSSRKMKKTPQPQDTTQTDLGRRLIASQ